MPPKSLLPPGVVAGLLVAATLAARPAAGETPADARPNILFAIADDWGWPHAGAYGDPVVQTPTFDRLAREGVFFEHAYVASPSCTPSRAAILTGQWHWRLEESANLWSTLRKEYPVYPDLLEADGYFVGLERKGWGPGKLEPGGRTHRRLPLHPELPARPVAGRNAPLRAGHDSGGLAIYDLRRDPDQLVNVAAEPEYREARQALEARLMAELRETGDPRVLGGAERLEAYPYYGGAPLWPGP